MNLGTTYRDYPADSEEILEGEWTPELPKGASCSDFYSDNMHGDAK